MLGFTRRRFARALPAGARVRAPRSSRACARAAPTLARADASKDDSVGSRSSSPTASSSIAASSTARRSKSSAAAADRRAVAAILAVFNDVPHATEWMDSCNGSRAVADIGDREKVVYNRTHAPWPVADRDAVLHNVARFDAAERRVELDFWSRRRRRRAAGQRRGAHAVPARPLEPVASADGAATRVEYQVHANPAARCPLARQLRVARSAVQDDRGAARAGETAPLSGVRGAHEGALRAVSVPLAASRNYHVAAS